MRNHFIARLTEGGGPSPLLELGQILHQGPRSEARTAWFGTRKPGTTWTPAPSGFPSIALVIAVEPGGAVEAVAARIVGRRESIPPIPGLVEFYGDHAPMMLGWWELADSRRILFPSLANLPGTSIHGLAAADSFGGQSTFAYWKFDLFESVIAASTSAPSWPSGEGLPDFFESGSLGEIRFKGHRINAYHVFSRLRGGQTPGEIGVMFPSLAPDQVAMADEYYRSHRRSIDPYLDRYRQDLDFQEASSKPGPSLAELEARRARRITEGAR